MAILCWAAKNSLRGTETNFLKKPSVFNCSRSTFTHNKIKIKYSICETILEGRALKIKNRFGEQFTFRIVRHTMLLTLNQMEFDNKHQVSFSFELFMTNIYSQ